MKKCFSSRSVLTLITVLLLAGNAQAFDPEGRPVFDAHVHYSHDVWESISPEEAIHILRDAGIARAMVSSSSDEGTQKLYQAAPDLVLPVLRPYRQRGTLETWMHDDSVIPYLEGRLAKYRYVAIGEFHIDGAEADLPVIRRIVQLAKQYDLILHVHSDADAVRRIYKQDPAAKILWAHAGFEYAYTIRELMQEHQQLWADLSFRREIYTNGRFLQDWYELLTDYADRFMLGVDTYTPPRWLQVQSIMNWQHALLEALPADVAGKIAFDNGERLVTARFKPRP